MNLTLPGTPAGVAVDPYTGIRRLGVSPFVAVAALALLLSGCGGGGKMPMPPGDATPTTPPHAMSRISQSADTLLVSDLLLSTILGDVRAQAECVGTNCTWTVRGEGVTVSLSEFSDSSVSGWPEASETRRGVSVFQVSDFIDEDDESFGVADVYGGWLEHNWFFVAGFTATDDTVGVVSAPFSTSVGDATGSNPVRGSATWSGVMSGVDVSVSYHLNQIRGDADLTIADFADPKMDVAFTNVRDVDAGRQRADMTWDDVPMTSGGFASGSDGNSIQGKFYGPNHVEAGGIFERDQIIGAFGAKRK